MHGDNECHGLSLKTTDVSSATLITFHVDLMPDAFVKHAHITFKSKSNADPFNAAIHLWEIEIKCDLNEDGYAPVKGIEWTTPSMSNDDEFRTPEVTSLIQYAVDRRKLLRSDNDKLQLAFVFSVQNPRISETDSEFKYDKNEVSLYIYYEEPGQSKFFS